MRWRTNTRRTLLVVTLAVGVLAGPAVATADAAAPWCDKPLWSSAKMPTTVLGARLNKAINIIEDVDHIADAATIALAFISGGVAAPALAVKFVVKLGKHRITRVLKKLIEQVRQVNRRKAGVRMTVKCLLGVAPYPSLRVYT